MRCSPSVAAFAFVAALCTTSCYARSSNTVIDNREQTPPRSRRIRGISNQNPRTRRLDEPDRRPADKELPVPPDEEPIPACADHGEAPFSYTTLTRVSYTGEIDFSDLDFVGAIEANFESAYNNVAGSCEQPNAFRQIVFAFVLTPDGCSVPGIELPDPQTIDAEISSLRLHNATDKLGAGPPDAAPPAVTEQASGAAFLIATQLRCNACSTLCEPFVAPALFGSEGVENFSKQPEEGECSCDGPSRGDMTAELNIGFGKILADQGVNGTDIVFNNVDQLCIDGGCRPPDGTEICFTNDAVCLDARSTELFLNPTPSPTNEPSAFPTKAPTVPKPKQNHKTKPTPPPTASPTAQPTKAKKNPKL